MTTPTHLRLIRHTQGLCIYVDNMGYEWAFAFELPTRSASHT